MAGLPVKWPMTRPTEPFIHLRRFIVDALTALAALALVFAAFNGAADAMQQVLVATILIATAAIVEPHLAPRRNERRPRPIARHSAHPA
jgi:hypothetical protein